MSRRLPRLAAILAAFLALGSSPAVPAGEPASAEHERIAIIGTGNVGSALGERWADAGHTVIYGSRRPTDDDVVALVQTTGGGARALEPAAAAAQADVVVLAIPWRAAEEVVKGLGALDGRILVDPINATDFAGDRVTLAHPGIAEAIAGWAPRARVVKALNTTAAENMRDPPAGHTITIPIAGDDPGALERVARLVADLGLEPRRVGPLYNARHIEAMGILYIDVNLKQRERPGLEFELHRVER